MNLYDLMVLHSGGIFNISKESIGKDIVEVGGKHLDSKQLNNLVKHIGWKEQYKSDVEILIKTDKLLRIVKKRILEEDLLKSLRVEAYEFRAINTLKTYYRYVIYYKGVHYFSVISGLPGSISANTAYYFKDGFSMPIAKGSTLGVVIENVFLYLEEQREKEEVRISEVC